MKSLLCLVCLTLGLLVCHAGTPVGFDTTGIPGNAPLSSLTNSGLTGLAGSLNAAGGIVSAGLTNVAPFVSTNNAGAGLRMMAAGSTNLITGFSNGVSIFRVSTNGDVTMTGTVKEINGDSTAGNGVESVLVHLKIVGQTNSTVSTTAFTVPVGATNTYEVIACVDVTTAGSAGTVSVGYKFTDADAGVAVGNNSSTTSLTGLGNRAMVSTIINPAPGSNVQYSYTTSGNTGGAGVFKAIWVLKRVQ